MLPPLNFTTTCTKSGRYVIFYNERLDGVTYPEGYGVANVITELCEVKVQGTYEKKTHFITWNEQIQQKTTKMVWPPEL